MAGLIPFNHRKNELSTGNTYGNLFNMMDDFFNDAWPFGRNLMNDTFKVDVQESDTAYTIEADMPGVQKDEIRLSLDDGRLTISMERNEETNNDKDNYIHRERRYSSMQRALYLADADDESVDASLNDGVLKIVVPKKTRADHTKNIEIK